MRTFAKFLLVFTTWGLIISYSFPYITEVYEGFQASLAEILGFYAFWFIFGYVLWHFWNWLIPNNKEEPPCPK